MSNDQQARTLVTEEQVEEYERFWNQYKKKPLNGRDQILAAFCPQVYGLYAIKLALAVILCGGVERSDYTGTKVRRLR